MCIFCVYLSQPDPLNTNAIRCSISTVRREFLDLSKIVLHGVQPDGGASWRHELRVVARWGSSLSLDGLSDYV